MCTRSFDMPFLSLVKFTFIKEFKHNSGLSHSIKIYKLQICFIKMTYYPFSLCRLHPLTGNFARFLDHLNGIFCLNKNYSSLIQSTASNSSLIGRLVPDDCLLLGPSRLSLRFSLALTSCES